MSRTTELLTICQDLIDPAAVMLQLHAGRDNTAVLRARASVGEVIVKVHRGIERHRQEVHAYHHWTPVLGNRVPRLLAVNVDPPAIVITAVPGRPLSDSSLRPDQEAEAHRQAGELLRSFHHSGRPRTEPNMTEWLADRAEYWLALAGGILPASQKADIRAHMRSLVSMGCIPAMPCHLDYMPRNIIYAKAGDGIVQLIDFEHSRYDLAARDLVRLATRVWPERPDLAEAFCDGYGPLSDLDRQVIEHCAYLDALTAAVRRIKLPSGRL